MLFPTVLFSFSVGTAEKISRVCRKYSLRNPHICSPNMSSDTQGEELMGVQENWELMKLKDPRKNSAERQTS